MLHDAMAAGLQGIPTPACCGSAAGLRKPADLQGHRMCVCGLAANPHTHSAASTPSITAGPNKRTRCNRRAPAAPTAPPTSALRCNCRSAPPPSTFFYCAADWLHHLPLFFIALQIGSTIFHTLAGVLLLLLVSPIYDGARIYYSTKDKPEQAALDLRYECVRRFEGAKGGQQPRGAQAGLALVCSCMAPLCILRPPCSHCLCSEHGALMLPPQRCPAAKHCVG